MFRVQNHMENMFRVQNHLFTLLVVLLILTYCYLKAGLFFFSFARCRCLHLICNSWKLFVEFPLFGEILDQSSCKRRKIVGDDLQLLADGMPTSVDNSGSTMLHIKNYKEDSGCGFKRYKIKPFKKAAECLLALNNSVYNLHQKKLFPYNPEVLLKRYVSWQCIYCSTKASNF